MELADNLNGPGGQEDLAEGHDGQIELGGNTPGDIGGQVEPGETTASTGDHIEIGDIHSTASHIEMGNINGVNDQEHSFYPVKDAPDESEGEGYQIDEEQGL